MIKNFSANIILKMRFFTTLILLITILIFLTHAPLTNAQQNIDLPQITIYPGMTYYPVKRLGEKIFEKFQFTSESKEKYYEELVKKRMAELKYVVDKDLLDQIEKSSQRLSYQIGILTDYVTSQKMDNKKGKIIEMYNQYKILLEQLRDQYPANTSFWMLVQHVINSIDINLQKL